MAICKQCGETKDKLGNHWNLSSTCSYPRISDKQMEMLTGILMGDGFIDRTGSNPKMVVEMINEDYLQYVGSILGNLSTGVSLSKTAEENSKSMRESGFRPNADPSNYSDVYILRTRRHPQLQKLADWYSSGKKIIPEIELTPTTLKHWYVCDGHLDDNENPKHRPSVVFGITNEFDRSDKLEKMLMKKGINSNTNNSKNLYIGVDDTERFFEFIGSPIDGFKYKWPQ